MAILFRRKNSAVDDRKSRKALNAIESGGGIIAIARGIYGDDLVSAVRAICDGGIRAVEVTFEQNGDMLATGQAITKLVANFGDKMTIGAGTVLTRDQLEMAYRSGAEYIVSPNTDQNIIRAVKSLGLASIPGAMTPSEIVTANACGADIVKIFPAGALGSAYFASVTTPLAHIKCAAVAGITVENIREFKQAGACAFGISSSILNKKLISEGRFDEVTARAAAFTNAVRS